MKTKSNTIDLIACASSFLCALHCAAIPFVVSFSSLNTFLFLKNPYIEFFFIFLGVIFVLISLWPSYKKIHLNAKHLFVASIGFVFILIGRFEFTELWEVTNTVFGALLVGTSHYFNFKILKKFHLLNH